MRDGNVHLAYLSAGTNLGDRKSNLERAIVLLNESAGEVRQISPFYETEPVGFLDQPWFLNAAIEIATTLTPEELLRACQGVENAQGRVRSFRNAPRTLDLDILFYDELTVDTPSLSIPHPRMTERRFVLVPLADIAPEAMHPVRHRTVREILNACPDASQIHRA